MRKKTIVILLTAIVFIAVAVLGTVTVFRVRSVAVDAAVISKAATEEVKDLQARLLSVYEKESTFFLDDKKARDIAEDFPYFRVTGFKKSYPDKIILQVVEDAELFAIKKADSEDSYIVGGDGTVLAIRRSVLNRLDDQPNIIVEGIGLAVSGEKGEKLQGNGVNTLLDFCQIMSERLNGLRDNVEKITVLKYAPEYCFTMREGVKIYIGAPDTLTKQKADALLEKYLSLTDSQRMQGRIIVGDKDGEIIISYLEKDF